MAIVEQVLLGKTFVIRLGLVDPAAGIAYFVAESRDEALNYGLRAELATGAVEVGLAADVGGDDLAGSRRVQRRQLALGGPARRIAQVERCPRIVLRMLGEPPACG